MWIWLSWVTSESKQEMWREERLANRNCIDEAKEEVENEEEEWLRR